LHLYAEQNVSVDHCFLNQHILLVLEQHFCSNKHSSDPNQL